MAWRLRFGELGAAVRRPVTRLVSLGVFITWVLVASAAHVLFHQPVRVSVLLGAILVVSGPTVVQPLLRLSRPREPSSTILKWEGIVIDPVGATLSLFCFNVFFIDRFALGAIWGEFIVVALAGIAAGMVSAGLFVAGLRRRLIPGELEVAVAFMLVVAAYVVAETVRPEAGLFATTTMGIVLANQRLVAVRQVRLFGEPIVCLIVGSLFIALASDVHPGAMRADLPETLALVAFMVLVIRPLAVLACTAGSRLLSTRHRAFLACMAPRGIVAASTAAFYSLRLQQVGQPSPILVPVTFGVIICLSIIYGLGAIPAARLLKVARPAPHGLLLVSPRAWAVGLARELSRSGIPVVLVARGRWDLAEREDLPFPVYADLIRDLPESDYLTDTRDAVVASPDDETNVFALSVLTEAVGRDHVFLLSGAASMRHDRVDRDVEAWTRQPFSGRVTLEQLQQMGDDGARVRTVDAVAIPPGVVPLIRLDPGGGWSVSPGRTFAPGTRLIVAEVPLPAAGDLPTPEAGRSAAGDQPEAGEPVDGSTSR